MKIGIYDVINNPLPQLYKLKEIEVNLKDFEYDEYIVNLLNKHLKMDKLSSENIYALSLTYGNIPRGIIQVSIGKCDSVDGDLRKMAIGLLLTGAEQFMCFHNHPGGNKNISTDDIKITKKYKEIGDLIGIHFCRHIMITQNYYGYCKDEDNIEDIPFS